MIGLLYAVLQLTVVVCCTLALLFSRPADPETIERADMRSGSWPSEDSADA